MSTILVPLCMFLLHGIAHVETGKLTDLPLDKGLPIVARVGVFFHAIDSFDEDQQNFEATVDVRVRWQDLRLRYPAQDMPRGYLEYRGEEATKRLSEIWHPEIGFANMKGDLKSHTASLRIFPSGFVELMSRNAGQFMTHVDATDFPFDTQNLGIDVTVENLTTNEVRLVFLQDDLDFSHAAEDLFLDGWTPRHVSITRANNQGWYGEVHSGLRVALSISRQYGNVVAPIFIPLLASLLIPLLAIWMNRIESHGFRVDAFDLANIIIGGLFAVIALNFTVNSEYHIVASSDNTVTRLFALNYAALAVSLAIIILLFRYNMPQRLWGSHVQEQIFACLNWCIPIITLGTALAVLLIAMA